MTFMVEAAPRAGSGPRRLPLIGLMVLLLVALVAARAGSAAAAEPQIDPSFGTLSIVDQDIGDAGGVLGLFRVHVPRESEPGMIGRGWRLSWESRLIQDGPALIHVEAGLRRRFEPEPGAAGAFRSGGDRITTGTDRRRRLARRNGGGDLFDAAGYLVERDLGNGNRITLSYSGPGQVSRVQGPFERGLSFTYGAGGRVTQVQDAAGRRIAYAYAGDRLAEARGPGAAWTRYAYDRNGRLTRIEEPRWGVTELAYDAQGRVTSRRSPGGGEERFQFDDATRTARHTDRQGGVTLRERGPDGRSETVTDPLGQRTMTEIDAQGRAIKITGPTGRSVTIDYDALGRRTAMREGATALLSLSYLGETDLPVAIVGANGAREDLEYDDRRNLIRVKQDGEVALTLTYLANGKIESVAEAGARVRRFTYYPNGRVFSVADGLNRTTRMEYDSRGNVARIIDAQNGVVQRAYDEADRLVSETDPTGAVTRYEYDTAGRLVREIAPGGAVTAYEYDQAGQNSAIVDGAGRRVQTALAASEFTLRGPDGRPQTLKLDPLGRLAEAIDVTGRGYRFAYDPSDQLTSATEPGGRETRYRYDAQGQPAEVEDSLGGKATVQWDARGRLAAIVGAGGATERYAYDQAGRLLSVTDALGNQTRHAYDAGGRLNGVTAASGDRTRYAYDSDGRLNGIWDAAGRQTQFAYDQLDRLVETRQADGRAARYLYDAAGRVVSTTDAAGRATRFAYGSDGRLATKTLPGGATLRYRYAPNGEPLEIDDGAYPLRFDYDAQGRLTAVQHGALRKSVRYAYDGGGNLASVTGTSDQAIRYRYAGGRLVAIDVPGGGAIELAYDAADRVQTIRYPNGTSGTWRFDASGRQAEIVYGFPQGLSDPARRGPTLGVAYTYDAAGNPVERRGPDSGQSDVYRYDADGRLIGERSGAAIDIGYGYRPGGDRAQRVVNGTTEAYAYGQAGRLETAASERFTHDPNGNITRRETISGATAYGWDEEGRLLQADTAGAVTRFGYAPNGERVSRRDRSGAVTRFVYDRSNLLEELGEDGSLRALYVHAPGLDRPLAMIRDGQVFFYHADALGTVLFLTDAAGRVAASYDTDAFGNVLKAEVAAGSRAAANPFIFTGREYDAELKLYYFRARYYDPALGRFLSVDPLPGTLNSPGSLNRYAYVLNAPTRYVDPMGTAPDFMLYERLGLNPATVFKYIQALQKSGQTPAQATTLANTSIWAKARQPGSTAASIEASLASQTARLTVPPAPPVVVPPTAVTAPAPAPAVPPVSAPAVPAALEAGAAGAAVAPAVAPAVTAPLSWTEALAKVRASGTSGLNTATAGLTGGAIAFVTGLGEAMTQNTKDSWINLGVQTGVGTGLGITGKLIEEVLIARGGTVAAATTGIRTILGRATPAILVATTAAPIGIAGWQYGQARWDESNAVQASLTNPIYTNDSVRRLIAGLRAELSAVQGLHRELTAIAATLAPGGPAVGDAMDNAQAKLERLKGMAPGVGARDQCGQLATLPGTIEQAVTGIEAKLRAASAIFGNPGDWPQSRARLDQAFGQAGEAATAAATLKTSRETLAKIAAASRPSSPQALEAARKLRQEIDADIAAAEAALGGGLSRTPAGQNQIDAVRAAQKKREFEGRRSALIVSTERVKLSVPRQFQFAWADANEIATLAQSLASPEILTADPGRAAAEQFVASAATLKGEADAVLQGMQSPPREVCPGLPSPTADLVRLAQQSWDRIPPQAQVLIGSLDARLLNLDNVIKGMGQLQSDNTRQIGEAEAKLRTNLPPDEKAKAEAIIRNARQGNVDAAQFQKKAQEEQTHINGKAPALRTQLRSAIQ